MKKPKIKIKREIRRMNRDKRSIYMLRHGKFIIKNAAHFIGIPNDGAAVSANAMLLQDLLSVQRKGKKLDIAYKDQLGICFDMMDTNYDFVDFVSGGDVDINNLSGLNSRKNSQEPKDRRQIRRLIGFLILLRIN